MHAQSGPGAVKRRGGVATWMCLMVITLWAASATAQELLIPRGRGTASNPYQISQLGHLAWIKAHVGSSHGKFYRMTRNIDARRSFQWYGGRGFLPIGNRNKPFNGTFDGNGKVIRGLVINRPGRNDVGLFGGIGKYGRVYDLNLSRGKVCGNIGVGALAGYNQGRIWRCTSSVTVTGRSFNVGGLVGMNYEGTVSVCRAVGSVRGGDTVGGLVGINHRQGAVSGCAALGSVAGGDTVGGLAGINYTGAKLWKSYSAGTVRGRTFGAGGLVGMNYQGAVSRCHAQGRLIGNADVGGLVGENSSQGRVVESYATAAVYGRTNVGGLAGRNLYLLRDCYARGRVVGRLNVGGLVGYNDGAQGGTAARCFAVGAVTGRVAHTGTVGGLIGANSGSGSETAGNSYWDRQSTRQWGSAGGHRRTTVQMKRRETFVGWNFRTIWRNRQYRSYPFLRRMPEAILSFGPVERRVGSGSGATSFVVSNKGYGPMPYKVKTSASWLRITRGARGNGRGRVYVAYAANPRSTARSGTVTVSADNATGSPQTVRVVQRGR